MARSMTFQIDDASTDAVRPAVFITITENSNGTLSFSITQQGNTIGDLRGLFFDLGDESLSSSLKMSGASAASSLKSGDDNIKDLGNGNNMNGLLGSDGGYDAGINIGSAGLGSDDIRSFNFTLSANRAMTLDDFANVDFGVRLTSVGTEGGVRSGSSKMLETTSAAIDAKDDAISVNENTVGTGNLLANDTNKLGSTTVTGWSGGDLGHAVLLDNGAGASLTVNADGSFSVDLSSADALSEGETLTYTFTYDAKSASADQTSSDSASFTVTLVGKNDGPVAHDDAAASTENAAAATGHLLANDSDVDRLDSISLQSFSGGDLGQAHAIDNAAGATVQVNADGSYTVDASAADALSAGEEIVATYSYQISDNHGATATAQLQVKVVGVNDGPVANDDAAGAFTEGALVSGSVAANDTDVDRLDTHTWAVVDNSFNGNGGQLSMNADGSWSYDAQGAYDYLLDGQSVDLSFTYVMTDNHGASDTAKVSFSINGVGSVTPEEPHGPQGNNGYGNGDQGAPGGSGDNNNAENGTGNGNGNGNGGGGSSQNNGLGNGDQTAPGDSLDHNNAENDTSTGNGNGNGGGHGNNAHTDLFIV